MENVLLISLIIVGVNSVTRPNKILSFVSAFATFRGENKFTLANVLSECVVCMSSLYGLVGFCLVHNIEPELDSIMKTSIAVLVFLSLSEIAFPFLGFVFDLKVPQKLVNRVQTAVKSLYLFALVYFLHANQIFDGALFILATTGTVTLFEFIMSGMVANLQQAQAIEADTQVAIKIHEENKDPK